MKLISALPLAALAVALVVPDVPDVPDADGRRWQDLIPTKESVEKVVSSVKDGLEDLVSGFEDAMVFAGDAIQSTLQDALEEEEVESLDIRRGDDENPGGTIYNLIKGSKYTTKLAALIDEHESVVKLLNSTDANYTLFAPIDKAFEHIPDHGKKPSKEFVESLLKYHVGLGNWPAERILSSHTIPTALDEAWLDDEPQRLRTRVGLGGLRVNFYSKVVAANLPANNGVIHGVRSILVPPPMVGRVLSLFPSKFSTLLLAYEKTDFVSFIHNVKMAGSTVFAPSNSAWDRLGPAANAFLFNTDKGLKYLKALLKYQIVANETLYSDAYYRHKDGSGNSQEVKLWDSAPQKTGVEHYHVDLPSLLDDKSIAVDITRWGGFIDLKVNGYIHMSVQDGIAKNGVIHVTDNVLIPHRSPPDENEQYILSGHIDEEQLKLRLAPFVHEDGDGDFADGEEEWPEL